MYKLIAFAAATALSGVAAQAATLTFEGQSNAIYNAPIDRSGFQLGNPAGQEQHFHEITSTAYPSEILNNGTGVLMNDRDTDLEVTLVGGGQFRLGDFDTSATGPGNAAPGSTSLLVTAYRNGVSVGTLDLLIGFDQYRTYSGASLGSFDRLTFHGQGGFGGFVLDNLNLTAGAVPEPATWAMMIGGFGLAGAAMRRRRTVAFA